MPIYEYQCQACGEPHEAMHSMRAARLRKCPACGKPRLVRLISAPMFRLKGAGWYETDFKSDKESRRNLHADEQAEKSEAAPAKDAKVDSKADGKTDGAAAPETKKVDSSAEPQRETGRSRAAPGKSATVSKRAAKAAKPAGKPSKRR